MQNATQGSFLSLPANRLGAHTQPLRPLTHLSTRPLPVRPPGRTPTGETTPQTGCCCGSAPCRSQPLCPHLCPHSTLGFLSFPLAPGLVTHLLNPAALGAPSSHRSQDGGLPVRGLSPPVPQSPRASWGLRASRRLGQPTHPSRPAAMRPWVSLDLSRLPFSFSSSPTSRFFQASGVPLLHLRPLKRDQPLLTSPPSCRHL